MSKNMMFTKNGHDLFEIASLLQKAIRRGDEFYAGYAANELRGRYNDYLWRKLLIISAEDCDGLITKEIVSLEKADNMYNTNKKGYDRCGIFISKAITILLKAQKCRDADWFACNMIQSEETLNIKEYIDLDSLGKQRVAIPEYAYDCHTIRGKSKGLTKRHMIEAEFKALNPRVKGLFDGRDWERFITAYELYKAKMLNMDYKYPHPTKEQLKELKKGVTSLFD